jgi:hypothetical protein
MERAGREARKLSLGCKAVFVSFSVTQCVCRRCAEGIDESEVSERETRNKREKTRERERASVSLVSFLLSCPVLLGSIALERECEAELILPLQAFSRSSFAPPSFPHHPWSFSSSGTQWARPQGSSRPHSGQLSMQ